MTLRRAAVAIDGMVCHSCVQSVSLALEDLGSDLAGFRVSLADNRADVTYVQGTALDAAKVASTIEDCGFDASVVEDVEVEGTAPVPGSELVIDMLDNGELAVASRKDQNSSLLSSDDVLGGPSELEIAPFRTTDLPSVPPLPKIDIPAAPSASHALLTPTSPSPTDQKQCETVFLRVEGMTCASCVNSITRKLLKVPGVQEAKVALLAEKAEVRFEPQLVNRKAIADAIDALGFEASVLASSDAHRPAVTPTSGHGELPEQTEMDFKLYGTTSLKDMSLVRATLEALSGVTSCFLDQQGRTTISFNPNVTGPRTFVDAVDTLGFNLIAESSNASQTDAQMQSLQRVKEIQSWRRALIVASAFTIPLIIINMILPQFAACDMWLMMNVIPGLSRMDLIGLVLSTPVQFYVGRRFYVASWKALKHGFATMDVLVVLGTSTAYFWSLLSLTVGILTGGRVEPVTFWETPASLITFVVLGRYLENVAKGRTTTALASLLSIGPTFATLLSSGTDASVSERKIPSELVQRNDILKLVPGEKFPADGIVVWGETTADESLLSGEARPVSKRMGDSVVGGTINQSGTVHIKATKVGSEMAVSQIVRLVDEAQTSRAPIQDIADRVAGVFVPLVVALGLITFVVWMILLGLFPGLHSHFAGESEFIICLKLCISVIVVACPCTLGLATPTAVMVGTGVGAQMGILIKGGAPLEMAGRIDKVLFDKTGTLTKGKLEVVETELLPGAPAPFGDDLAVFSQLVGLAESYSEHPLGRAVAAHALNVIGSKAGFDGRVVEFLPVAGAGIFAQIELRSQVHSVVVGNLRLLRDRGFSGLSEALQAESDSRTAKGRTVIWAMIDGTLAGMLVLADTLKLEAKDAVLALQSMGLAVAMVTGDSRRTAEFIAHECGITEIHAEISPSGKADIVDTMQASGFHIAFVGDGVNDSIAISKAKVGIAVGAGTDVTMEAAQIVLVKDNLLDVATALHLSRTIFSRIRLNFVFSFIYNAVMIPIAMGCLIPINVMMPPMAAGFAMAMSSVSVVMSSLMLKRYKRPDFCVPSSVDRQGFGDGTDVAEASSFVTMDVSDEEALLDRTSTDGAGGVNAGNRRHWNSWQGRATSLVDSVWRKLTGA